MSALSGMAMPKDEGRLRSLLGSISYYWKHLPSLVKCAQSLVALLKKSAALDFTSAMAEVVREQLQD